MIEKPLVSVVMGVYNGSFDLPKTLESILSQESVDIEFIVVDDGSTDATPVILQHYASIDSRLRIFRQENQGLTIALILGCNKARGEFIARQDAGDLSDPGRLQAQVEKLREFPNVAFCSCWARMVAIGRELLFMSKGAGLSSQPRWILDPSASHGIEDGPSVHGSVMMRCEAYQQVGGYRSAFRVGQDWDLWYRLAAFGQFIMVEQPLYTYRFDGSGITATRAAEQSAFAKLSLKAMRIRAQGKPDNKVLQEAHNMKAVSYKPSARISRARMNYFVASNLIQNGDPKAIKYLLLSLRDMPFSPQSWLKLAIVAWLKLSKLHQCTVSNDK